VPLLDDVSTYLAASTGLSLTVATSSGGNLYKIPFPEASADAAVCLIEYAGGPIIRAMSAATTSLSNAQAPVAETVRFQVLVREDRDSYQDGRTLIENIYKTVDHVANVTLGSTRYLYMKALAPPAFLAYDANGRPRFYLNVETLKERG
jgi:hypothetical protein